MDDLWDPPDYQAIEDTHCRNDGCQCTFCLANDVVEEKALNEISCIEVLTILISKADTNIVELEDELLDLLSQLVCTNEEFSNMVSMCLRREIDFLDGSIKKLKNDAEDYQTTRSRKPAESLFEILKSLFCHFIQKKDIQCADNTKNIASSSCQVHSDIPFREKKQTISPSNANQIEKNKGIMNTSLEKHKISQTKVKTEEDDSDYSYTGLCVGSMENWKHQLVKIKSQTDEETIGSKSSTPNTKINSDKNLNPDNLQEASLSLSSNKTYKRRQTLNPPLQTIPRSPCLLLEGADVANTRIGSDMDYYKVDDLKAIARQRGLKGYSKLRKSELAQTLGIKIFEGKKKQNRKETLTLALTLT